MVSGCYSSTGDAYLWGANTNSQLGKGDAVHASCLSAYIGKSRLAQFSAKTHLQSLSSGRNPLLLITFCIAGDDDTDESVPLKLKETKRFKNRHVVGMEIGGQMTFILSKLRPEAVAAADHTAGHTPPEPAPADMQA